MPDPIHDNRLADLRKELAARGLDGFVVPISDEHMSEYVGAYAQRLEWLTGFRGSAGTAVVLADKAVIFTDGRYTLQVRDQVNGKHWDYESVPETSPAKWLGANAPQGAKIGYDAWLHSKPWVKAASEALEGRGANLFAVENNPVDAVWPDRPKPSAAPAEIHPESLAGKSSAEKRAAIAEWLKDKQLDAVVIAALDSIAWLLNVRGRDIERTPVTLAYVLVHADGTAELFIAPEKVIPEVAAHLGNAVKIRGKDEFVPALASFEGKRIAADPANCVAGIFAALERGRAKVVEAQDPCILPKAIKNEVERAGTRAAHIRDGAAVTRFLHWLAKEGPKGGLTEIAAAEQLHQFRREAGDLRDLSFDTISGSGPNGAIVHYRVSEATNRTLLPGSIYLVDSGGQYPDGTTDITRTVWIGPGEPTREMKDRYTRVLRGHIALARQKFPVGTIGSQLDTLARQFLWNGGVDYAHGTGHGVGSYLAVHEGPQRIAKPRGGQAGGEQELLPGMILSNEPGYYKAGEYGIRIENLVLVEEREVQGAEGDWLGFEQLTLAPINRDLIDFEMLRRQDKAWWNFYHARVWEALSPLLEGEVRDWLDEQCALL
ncbi:MAG TPA: aminopeptidase P family protein [Sphingomonadaceae bacterium]|nr:aminopeptidase P family protein [Sphingomonadaceae bacterium]